jgi:hypothetical protein
MMARTDVRTGLTRVLRRNVNVWIVHTRSLQVLSALAAAALLTGCNGSNTEGRFQNLTAGAIDSLATTTFLSGPVLEVESDQCRVASTSDTGTLLYVVMGKECTLAQGVALDFTVISGTVLRPENVQHTAATFPELGTALPLDLPFLGARDVTVFQEGQWRRIANDNSWSPRDGAGLLIKDNKAYLLGGWAHGPTSNEVWVTQDLLTWEFLGNAPWPPRHGSGWVVHNDRLYVIGGDLLDDVWSSADGIEWRQEAANAPFGRRYTPNAVSINGKLVVYAGQHWFPIDWCSETPDCGVVGNNDVWESADDGKTWTVANPAAPWPGRGLIHGSIVFNGEIWLIGGGLKGGLGGPAVETITEFTDIWSSPDGHEWRQRSPTLPFPGRTHVSVLSTPFGCYVSDGSVGTQANVSNDLFFAPDCLDYRAIPNPPLQKRHASSVAYFNGTVVILGGPVQGGALTDVWQYIPAAADSIRP